MNISKNKILILIGFITMMLSTDVRGQTIVDQSVRKNQYAKFPSIEVIDKAILECIYEYFVIDVELKETKSYYDILQLGRKKSKYFGYPIYQIDSVIYKKDITKITFQEAGKIYNKYGFTYSSPYTIIKNLQTKKIEYYDRVFTDRYIYPDSVAFSWKPENETKTICGYLCKKATTFMRGREWIAYYAPDIALSAGPWKFAGLPGLILHIEDKNSEHKFTAISIRKAKDDMYKEKASNRFTTDRQRFNKLQKNYKANPGNIMSGSQLAPKDATGKELPIPNRKLFYNPIELE